MTRRIVRTWFVWLLLYAGPALALGDMPPGHTQYSVHGFWCAAAGSEPGYIFDAPRSVCR